MIEVHTPSRLHFGLLALSRNGRRQFGGAGLMVRRPDVAVRVRRTPDNPGLTATGRMADRALEFATRFFDTALERGWTAPPRGVAIDVMRVPRPHTGLGSGTQLGMAIAKCLSLLIERDGLTVAELAAIVGRGRRSAIGAHGFACGGFLVDGGKFPSDDNTPALAPIVMRHPFPEEWRIVLIRPRALEGIAGKREAQAFADMPAIPDEVTQRMSRLVLLGLAPALVERDIAAFGESLFELQREVGSCFAGHQGGIYADPQLDAIVNFIRGLGIHGVGQSSWGPTLYAITPDEPSADHVATAVEEQFGLQSKGEVIVTTGDNDGCTVRRAGAPSPRDIN
ncbi:MAG: beta-RFAP synthase [Planctomycetes bacterium]|nr:beta-RFAP synthase [Planctomycetota bacterium]